MLEWDFSVMELLIFWARDVFVVGVTLHIVGCLAAPLASTHLSCEQCSSHLN